MKQKNNFSFLLIRILFLIFFLSFLKSNAQGLDLSWQISYEKFSLQKNDRMSFFTEVNHYNSIELGAILSYKAPKPILVYSTGLLYNRMCYEYFTLNALSIPLSLNFRIGDKKGVFWGGGMKLRYLMNKPDDFFDKDNFNSFLLSYIWQLGIFYKHKKLLFKLHPQIEFFQTPLYYSKDWHGKIYHYLNMVSLNLNVSFKK